MSSNVRSRARRGFTLVELVAVVVVMLLLVGVAFFGYTAIQRNVRASAAKDVLRTIAAAQKLHFESRGSFVASGSGVSANPTDLQQVANNQPGYTAGNVAPTVPLQVSAAQGYAHGQVPVVALATTIRGGTCVVLAAFPTDAGRDNREGVFKRGDYSTCTGNAALELLDVAQPPATGSNLPAQVAWVTISRSTDSLRLSWDAVPGAAGYKVFRTAPGEATLRQVHDVRSGTTYTDAGLAATYAGAPAVYVYRVAAYNADGNGPQSPDAQGTPGAEQVAAVKAPTELEVKVRAGNDLSLSWDGDSKTYAYRVLRDGTQVAHLVSDGTVAPATTHTITGNVAEKAYTLQVVAYSSASDTTGTPSSTLTAVTLPNAPGAISAAPLSVTPDSAASCTPALCVEVVWNRPETTADAGQRRATSHRLYRCRISDGCADGPWATDYTLVGAVGAGANEHSFTFTDTGLESGTYRYAVAGVNEAGVGLTAAFVDVSTVPGAVSNVRATSTVAGTNVIAWNATPGATGYAIWGENTAGDWVQLNSVSASTLSWSHKPGTNNDDTNTSYRYRVSATTSSGAGNWSAAVTVNPRPYGPPLSVEAADDTLVISFAPSAGLSYDLYRDGSLYQSNVRTGYVDDVGWDTTRTYTLAARNIAGASSIGAASTATTAPSPVTRIPAVTVTPSAGQDSTYTTVISDLPPTDNQHAYRIYSCATSALPACASPSQLGQAAAGATSWSRSGALSTTVFPRIGSTEYWGVALHNLSTGKTSDVSNVFTVKQVPATPVNVTAAYAANGDLVISWDSDNHATDFVVSDSTRTELARVKNNTAGSRTTVTLAKADTSDVTASNPLYLASFNGPADLHKTSRHVTVPAPSTASLPPQVTALRADPSGSAITLNWRAPGATSYRLVRCSGACDPRTAGTSIAAVGGVSAVNGGHNDTATSGGITYNYSVSVSKNGGSTWSAWSAPVATSRGIQAVTDLTSTSRTTTSVAVTWTAAPGAAGYYVYVDGVLRDTISNATASGYTFDNLATGVGYTFGVRAYAAGGATSDMVTTDDYTDVEPQVLQGRFHASATQISFSDTKGPGPSNITYEILNCTGSVTCQPNVVMRALSANELGGHQIVPTVPANQIIRYMIRSKGEHPDATADSNIITHRNAIAHGVSAFTASATVYRNASMLQGNFSYTVPTTGGAVHTYRDGAGVCGTFGTACLTAATADQAVSTSKIYYAVWLPDNSWNDTTRPMARTVNTPPGRGTAVTIGNWNNSGGNWQITWSAVPGATQYRIIRSAEASGGTTAFNSFTTNGYDSMPNYCDRRYYYRMEVIGPYGTTDGPWASKIRGGKC